MPPEQEQQEPTKTNGVPDGEEVSAADERPDTATAQRPNVQGLPRDIDLGTSKAAVLSIPEVSSLDPLSGAGVLLCSPVMFWRS
ncbi:hypothetical protein [Pseudoduganella sp. UC29_71]|uniref:hypothetical protein n=1 Tax=Pseudoduganella sp. UC29_71 TaxID=3350174 RepID=UPI00366C4C4E